MSRDESGLSLVCRVGSRLCALPLGDVLETLRPLPVEVLPGAPDFVLGVSIIRGAPVPIIDAAALLAGDRSSCGRLVMVRVERRAVAIGVDEVVGVRAIAPSSLRELPPLLGEARQDGVASLGALDRALLVVLHGARIVPEAVWAAVAAGSS